jgi:hypothetical protein
MAGVLNTRRGTPELLAHHMSRRLRRPTVPSKRREHGFLGGEVRGHALGFDQPPAQLLQPLHVRLLR